MSETFFLIRLQTYNISGDDLTQFNDSVNLREAIFVTNNYPIENKCRSEIIGKLVHFVKLKPAQPIAHYQPSNRPSSLTKYISAIQSSLSRRKIFVSALTKHKYLHMGEN